MSGAAFGLNLTALARCPDCLSESRTVEIAPGVYAVQVFHDDTCPILHAKTST